LALNNQFFLRVYLCVSCCSQKKTVISPNWIGYLMFITKIKWMYVTVRWDMRVVFIESQNISVKYSQTQLV
jgi:hypothetical protein